MKEYKVSIGSGIGLTGLLALLFIAFKLCGIITWSWFWVLAPLWIPWVLTACVALVLFIIYLIIKLVS